MPLRSCVRMPSETSRNGARSARCCGASGSARTFAIQPSFGVRDCMAQENTKQPTGPLRHPLPRPGTDRWTQKCPERFRRPGAQFVSFNFPSGLIFSGPLVNNNKIYNKPACSRIPFADLVCITNVASFDA
jgi:hypothetical protein